MTIPTFNDPKGQRALEKVGKEENAGHQHFLHFPKFFYPIKEIILLATFGIGLCFENGTVKQYVVWFRAKPLQHGKGFALSRLKHFVMVDHSFMHGCFPI